MKNLGENLGYTDDMRFDDEVWMPDDFELFDIAEVDERRNDHDIDFAVSAIVEGEGERTKWSTSTNLPSPQPQNQTKYHSKGCGMAQSIPRSLNPMGDEAEESEGYVIDGKKLNVSPRVVLGGVVPRLDPKVSVEKLQMDTWREGDGTIRLLNDDEKAVVALLRKVRDDGEWKEVPNLRAVDRKRLMKEVDLVDGVMHNLLWRGMLVGDVNRLLYAGGAVVALRLGLKLGKRKKGKAKKPMWQRRIEASITRWRGHLSKVEEIRKGKKVGEKLRNELERKYQLTERGRGDDCKFFLEEQDPGW